MPPVVGERPRLLLLGSMPGARSLAEQRYYAHPRNQFWALMEEVTGRELRDLTYEERLNELRNAGVALWDVFEFAERQGSLDGDIRAAVANDLAGFVMRHPTLRAVGFNGGAAARAGRRALGERPGKQPGPALVDLPSSSPAYARMSLAEKADRWKVLAQYL